MSLLDEARQRLRRQQIVTATTPANGGGNHEASAAALPANPNGVAIITDFFRQHYRPVFRRGNAVVCADGREVPMNEACAVITSALVERLAVAADAPRFKGGSVNRDALPGFFKRWSRVAWGDLLTSLPEEDEAELAGDSAAGEEFCRLVRDALLSEVVLGEVIGKAGTTQTERRSLTDWCARFAKPGPWRSIRSKKCWCKQQEAPGGELVLLVAIRHELFAQLRADRRLCEMGAKKFTRRAERYGVGASTRNDRPHGLSAIVLARAFVAALVATLPDDGEEREIDRVDAPAHET
jgi:hypothetical protein